MKAWFGGGPPDAREREEHAKFRKVDAAFRAGDMTVLQETLGAPDLWLEGVLPPAIGASLEYAVYHSPLSFIESLLDAGANPSPEDHSGFPPLIAALSCTNERPGAKARADVTDVIDLLLRRGADPNQRGVNDYTPLHMAVAERNARAVDILLGSGADPALRTRIDAFETPREMAEKAGLVDIAKRLGAAETSRPTS